jgi:small subunit ribosomal protein S34
MSGTNVFAAFQKLLPKNLPPGLSTKPANLYQVLSRYAADGIGQHVYQTRWTSKGISDCYWTITRTSLKNDGTHGKAWGRLVWRGQSIECFFETCGACCANYACISGIGKEVSPREERIRGGLKYSWKNGVSRAPTRAPTISNTPVVP